MIYNAVTRLRMAKAALRTPIPRLSNGNKAHLLEPVVSPFRVLPQELDMRDHLPNYAFFRFAEININKWAYVTGVDGRDDYDVWILAATQIVFLQQIKAMQRFHVVTKVMHWDEKYAYYQHEFFIKYGTRQEKRAAILLSKLVFSAQGKQTPPAQLLGELLSIENKVVTSWLANQAEMKAFFS